jgi:hypothetical protein
MQDIPAVFTGPSGFKNFVYLSWKAIGLPDPTPVQYDIADFMQHGGDRVVVEAFRGVGKSYIASAFCVWTLLLDPTKLIQVVSGSKIRADDFTTFTLRLLHEMGELTEHLLPRDDQRNSKVAFDVGPAPPSHSPSLTSKGIFSQLTGGRADIIIADDVVTKQNSATQSMRDKIASATEEFNAILKPDGRVMYLGTPQSEQDLLHELPNRGYTVRIWPSEIPSQRIVISQGDRLAPMIREKIEAGEETGTPVDPLRFDLEDLERRRQGYGKTGYAMQFLLDQSMADADRYPLKINDLIVDDLDLDTCYEKYVWANDPDLRWSDPSCPGFNGDYYHRPLNRAGKTAAYEGAIMSVDPSGKGLDETAYAVVASYGGQLFVLESGGIQGGYDAKVLARLAEIARRNKVSRILCEENFGQGMFEALLVPVLQSTYPCAIEGVRHHIQKERRICDVLEPLMNSHKLIFNRKVWIEDWESVKTYTSEEQQSRLLGFQISRITRDRGALRHDDRVDALAMACEFWVRAMARDTDRHMQAEDDERQRRVIEGFLRRAVGGPAEPPAPNFVTARPL